MKQRLIAAPLTDREAMPYLAAYVALTGAATAFPPVAPNGWDTASGLASVPVGIIGTIWVFWQNGGPAGSEFLQRYLALSWVLLVRFVPVMATLLIVADVMSPAVDLEQTGPVSVILTFGGVGLLYQRLGAHVRHVARAVAASSQPARERDAR